MMVEANGVLSPGEHAVLDAVCETLLPSISRADDPAGFFAAGARALGTADRAVRLIGSIPDPGDRDRLRLLLRTLDNPFVNLLFTGRFARFTAMQPPAREAVLRGFAHSHIALRRAGFQALKRLVHVAHYCWPPSAGTRHPAWDANGYPGPLPQPAKCLDPLPTLSVDRDTVLECDAVVVGSGAGGGVMAGVLAEAGMSVVVLEKGGNPGSRDFTQVEGDMLSRYYLDGGLIMTQSGSLPILAGSCLGGGPPLGTHALHLPALPALVRPGRDPARRRHALYHARRARPAAGARLQDARLARGPDSPQRHRLPRGCGVRALRLRLPPRTHELDT